MERSNRMTLGSAAAEVGKEAEITPSHKRIQSGIIRGESGEKTDKKLLISALKKGLKSGLKRGLKKG